MELLGNGTNILLIVLGFGLLIAVHELGHFLAARWAGIRVDAFAIGMGPSVLSWRRGIGLRLGGTAREIERRFGCAPEEVTMARLQAAGVGETEYSLRALPLGGFVRMKGQEDLQPVGEAGDPDAYPSRPVWKRMVVVSAGVIMNLLLAILLYVIAFMIGVRFESATVGDLRADGPAATARSLDGGTDGLLPGDRIERVDGAPMSTFADVQIAVAMSRPGQDVVLQVSRPGLDHPLRFQATPTDDPGARLRSLAMSPAREPTLSRNLLEDPMVPAILTRSGMAAAGIGPAWRLLSIGRQDVRSGDALSVAAARSQGASIETRWSSPDGTTKALSLQPLPILPRVQPEDDPGREEFSLLGLSPLVRIDWVRTGSLNEGILRSGDVVLALGDVRGPRLSQFRELIRAKPSARVELEILRDGAVARVPARVDASGRLEVVIAPALETPLLARPIHRATLDGTATATPTAGLEITPLSCVTSVAGAPVRNWTDLALALHRHGSAASSITLGIRDLGATSERILSMPLTSTDQKTLRDLGWSSPLPPDFFDPLMVTLGAPGRPLEAASLGFHETTKLATLTWLTLDRLARGSVPVDQLRGPVGIVHVGTRVADRGMTYLVFFLAMISVNLAVLNFLPLPIVDGGLFLYLVYEALRGRPPSVRFQNAATMAGLLLIGGLFMVTFYNDVMRLVTG